MTDDEYLLLGIICALALALVVGQMIIEWVQNRNKNPNDQAHRRGWFE